MGDLKQVIEKCFEDMYIVARFSAKKQYKTMKRLGEQYNVARGLVFLRDVSKNPDKYFSVENTNAAWNERVDSYISKGDLADQDVQKYGMNYVRRVTKGCLVWGPGGCVYDGINSAWQDRDLWNFCQEVEHFYYKKLYTKVYVNDRFISEYAHKMAELADVAKQKNPIKRSLMKLVNSNCRNYGM